MGHIRVMNDIWDALIKHHFTQTERKVIDVIIRQTWGYNKDQDEIALSQFEEKTGIERRQVFRSIKSLSQRKVISVVSRGDRKTNLYCLNKHYSNWIAVVRRDDSKKTVVRRDDKSVVNSATHNNTRKDNKSSNELLGAKPPREIKKNKLIERVLELFEEKTGVQPTDRQPRNRAWNLVQKTGTALKLIRPFLPEDKKELDEKGLIERGFDWYFGKYEDVSTTTVDAVKRHIVGQYYVGLRKKLENDYKKAHQNDQK